MGGNGIIDTSLTISATPTSKHTILPKTDGEVFSLSDKSACQIIILEETGISRQVIGRSKEDPFTYATGIAKVFHSIKGRVSAGSVRLAR